MTSSAALLLASLVHVAAVDQQCAGAGCDGTADSWINLLQTRHVTELEPARTQVEEHYWSRRGGNPMMNSYTPYTAPSNFSQGPSWIWNNSLDEQVRHSPLIDSNKNIYVSTGTRILKFSRQGDLLWTWQPDLSDRPARMVASPALYGQSLYACVVGLPDEFFQPPKFIAAYSVDMATGANNWKSRDDTKITNLDAASVFVYNDTMIFARKDNDGMWNDAGNDKVYALNATDGSFRWEYQLDDIVWNFAPATLGDGSLLVANSCGGVYRISFDGQLIYRVGRPHQGRHCSAGGGALASNGMFYIEWRDNRDPGSHIDAYRVSDGALVWNRTLEYNGWQYPAVGKLTADGPLAVVAAIGEITGLPTPLNRRLESNMNVTLPNAVVALDAETGTELWRSHEEPWHHLAAAGDMGPMATVRAARAAKDPSVDTVCFPDIQGIPLISGDGTVYASSSHHGDLRAFRDADGNGVIDPWEESVFHTGNCFLNSPSLAPGMLVAAPCWGPMYVFLDE